MVLLTRHPPARPGQMQDSVRRSVQHCALTPVPVRREGRGREGWQPEGAEGGWEEAAGRQRGFWGAGLDAGVLEQSLLVP